MPLRVELVAPDGTLLFAASSRTWSAVMTSLRSLRNQTLLSSFVIPSGGSPTYGRTYTAVACRSAASPTPRRRWANYTGSPQAPEPWTEPLDATEFRERRPQNADLGVFATPGGKEDCLYLNVFASKSNLERRRRRPPPSRRTGRCVLQLDGAGAVAAAGASTVTAIRPPLLSTLWTRLSLPLAIA